jgi:hypothetical protein
MDQTCLGRSGGFAPCQLSFVPRHPLGPRGSIHLFLHGHTPRLSYEGDKHEPQGWAMKSDPLSGESGLRRPAMRQTRCSD